MGQYNALSLKEIKGYDCVFWKKDQGCSIYEARPIQCRTYPFWPGILDSSSEWNAEKRNCPGIGKGAVRSRFEIEEALWAYRANTLVLLPKDSSPETIDEDTVLGG